MPLLPFLVVIPWACSSHEDVAPSAPTDGGADQTGAGSDGAASDMRDGRAPGSTDAPMDTGAQPGPDASPDALATDASGDAAPACAAPSTTPTPVSGHLTFNKTLSCDHSYLFYGIVFVDAGATLTIEPGTTIHMADDASLLVAPGAKLIAVGTRDQPIVFTSAKPEGQRAPGDWGCVALVGKAPGNWGKDSNGAVIMQQAPDANDWPGAGFPLVAGGDFTPANYSDTSGTLKYVRLEYGGFIRINNLPGTEHEMLGLYGVGTGTLIDYIDMRRGNFGCLFAEGGAFAARHLVCEYGGNTAFGFTRGNQSMIQFLVDLENPAKAAEGLGIKGPFDSNSLPPVTEPSAYNITLCGTNGSLATSKDPYGIFLRRQPSGHIYNAIVSGFRAGMAMLNGSAVTDLQSSIFFGNFDPTLDGGVSTNIAYGSPPNAVDLVAWFKNPLWNDSEANPGIGDCFDANTLKMAPTIPLTANAATPPNDGFFDTSAAYIGAFKDTTDTWATGEWIVWSDK
jgi:hypothetical protein